MGDFVKLAFVALDGDGWEVSAQMDASASSTANGWEGSGMGKPGNG